MFTASALATAYRSLAFCFLVEVRELVCTEQEFLALSCVSVASLICSVDSLLNLSSSSECEESAFVLYREEEFPSFLSDSVCEVLDIVRTTSYVYDFVEVSFFLEEELLVASKTL